jgi:hypothetical protein
MPFFTFGLPMCIAISMAVVTAFGFTCFALIDDAGTVRTTWDWFAVAVSLILIATILVIAKQAGQIAAAAL